MGGESVKVMESLSAVETGDLKTRRARSPAPLRLSGTAFCLRAGVGHDVGAWAVLVPGLAADGAVHAVGDRGRRLDVQLRGDDRRVVRLQERDRHACVA